MANDQAMWAGLGTAVSDIGKFGVADTIEKRKEQRLQKIQLESESRAETRQISAEGRAEARQLGAEGRADTRAERDRAAKNEDEAAGDARKHKNRLAELRAASNLTREELREKARLEQEADGNGSRIKQVAVDGTFDTPGGVLFFDERGGQAPTYFDPATMQMRPVDSGSTATPKVPVEAEAAARKLAEQDVDGKTSVWNSDSTDLKEYGGDRETAITIIAKKKLPEVLKSMGYEPAEYGFRTQGLVSEVDSSKPAPVPMRKDTSRPVVLPPAGNSSTPAAPATVPANGGLPPAAVSRLREGAQTAFGNGQVWTLKGGVPTRVK